MKQGIEFRKKALKSPDLDLGSIARTAPALSTSPDRPAPIVAAADVRRRPAHSPLSRAVRANAFFSPRGRPAP